MVNAGELHDCKGVLVTGGTGFVGSALVKALVQSGVNVSVLTRNVEKARHMLPEGVRCVEQLSQLPARAASLGVVNLAGANLAGRRWSPAYKSELLTSRLRITGNVIDWMESISERPACLINASAVGIYGDRGDEILTEASTGGLGFGHRLCRDWEAAAQQVSELNVRLCIARLGVVLDRSGGAFDELVKPYRFKLCVTLGTGKNWLSWIHRLDAVNAILYLLEEASCEGIYNLCAPEPITYAQLAATMRQRWGALFSMPVPAFAVKALVGEFAPQVLLTSQRVMPKRLQAAGFSFQYSTIGEAMAVLGPARVA